MTNFKKGDVVWLKSGGPRMTVNYKTANGSLSCVWFDENNKMCNGNFFAEALTDQDPKAPLMPSVG